MMPKPPEEYMYDKIPTTPYPRVRYNKSASTATHLLILGILFALVGVVFLGVVIAIATILK